MKPKNRTINLRFAVMLLITAGCLFGAAGTLTWWNGWAYILVSNVLSWVLMRPFLRSKPDLAEERLTAGKKAKSWDRVLVPLVGGVLPLLLIVLAGLDKRFGWTHPVPLYVPLTALVLLVPSIALTFWAMKSNPFFSSHVRIQTDRGHKVVTSGPYRYVRHPGYTGSIFYNLTLPILLTSSVAFCVGLAILILLVVRTALEDRTLKRELGGYSEYARRVRFRLLPYVW